MASVLESAENVRAVRTQQIEQTEDSAVVHTRRPDPRIPISYELLWENGSWAILRALELHLETHANTEFDYQHPDSAIDKFIYAEPVIRFTVKSATSIQIRTTIARAMAQDT